MGYLTEVQGAAPGSPASVDYVVSQAVSSTATAPQSMAAPLVLLNATVPAATANAATIFANAGILSYVTAGGVLQPATTSVVALTDAATVAVNAGLGTDFRLTLGGSHALGNPSNAADGQKIIFQVTQGAGAPWLLTYGTAYEFSASLPQPTLSGAAGRTDILGFVYNAAKATWLFIAFLGGFA